MRISDWSSDVCSSDLAALYIDALLGKHFALLGSTGTGKSTAAALILHRICQRAPQGHIVMVDPHGEYGAAFKTAGAVYDVGNLQMPYWLMNRSEEHTSELQSLMRISYAVFCLKKKKNKKKNIQQ